MANREFDDPPVTVTLALQVRRGQEEAFEAAMHPLVNAAVAQPGHLGSSTIRPQEEGAPYRFLYKFAHQSDFDAWHRSPLRRELFKGVEPLVEKSELHQEVGLDSWLTFDGRTPTPAPVKWKATFMTWLAIFPLATLISYGISLLPFELPLVPRIFLLTVLVVPAASYLVVPRLAARMHAWLIRR